MVRPFLAIAVILGSLATGLSAAVFNREFSRTYAVGDSAVLSLDTFSGAITVQETEGTEIQLIVRERMEAPKEEDVDGILNPLDFKDTQQGSTVDITVRYPRDLRWSWQSWPPVQLAFEIKVPRRTQCTLRTRVGNITVGKLEGNQVVRNESGALFVGETRGNVQAKSLRGSVSVTSSTGDVEAETLSGNILIGRVDGASRLKSSGGEIELQTARGAVEIKSNASDVTVGYDLEITQPTTIETSGGNVLIRVDRISQFSIDARASTFGEVRVRDLVVEATKGAPGKSRLAGAVNGGGALLSIDASGGHITFRGLGR